MYWGFVNKILREDYGYGWGWDWRWGWPWLDCCSWDLWSSGCGRVYGFVILREVWGVAVLSILFTLELSWILWSRGGDDYKQPIY